MYRSAAAKVSNSAHKTEYVVTATGVSEEAAGRMIQDKTQSA